MKDVIPVYYGNIIVGSITPEPDITFTYSNEWLGRNPNFPVFPVSLSMPLSVHSYGHSTVTPWLMNLLPEGDPLAAAGRALGVSTEDVIGMLSRIGQDVAGALSVGRKRTTGKLGYRLIESDAELEKIINELPRKPFLVGDEGVSMSLAGAQEKLPVTLSKGKLYIPINGAPSTHILKPDAQRLPGGVQNEAFCLTLAHQIGLDASEVTTGVAGKRSWCLVTRYDREIRDNKIYRLHQEDFCQALGFPPALKYERGAGKRGVTINDMVNITKDLGGDDTYRLLQGIIFNTLITNGDAHAKNFSILLSGKSAPKLAPLYDLMCAAVWPHINKNMAQSIGNQKDGKHLMPKNWERLAKVCNFNPRMVINLVGEMAEKVERGIDKSLDAVRSMPAGDSYLLDGIKREISERCRSIKINIKPENTYVAGTELIDDSPTPTPS
ncbi:HipA domain-containing protein [Acetobacter pasteurianus NBRC 3280]|uniref:HipA domain-containing protein n=1 Tax=Acetobacter pasteurianus NBRC 3278 TaxID=1226660 RepID=A0A401X7K7_ACEPA|nr:type II toxin-antitoxin system HipA family toxin [Acetobacter pasteurianus]GCD59995.1 HipA domain-containing protein [Acetobacter pasteurianus NBRC 3277]GCD63746.1 HipA domain-containing protein [Acetobacter pasteurianus NBRC 3278]GCD69904.1 HipA domain-containing protein [Acetobacter pasteurianus NBRC 3280]